MEQRLVLMTHGMGAFKRGVCGVFNQTFQWNCRGCDDAPGEWRKRVLVPICKSRVVETIEESSG